MMMLVPKKSFGHDRKDRLPSSLPMIGLGCVPFSRFYWQREEKERHAKADWTVDSIDRNHPIVQGWIETIVYAVTECGITLLDTAPWYGQGVSETVIGWAMEKILLLKSRQDLMINTKIGRYEVDPKEQFDFRRETTLRSVERSIRRMRCEGYVDVLQLHDPEFSPTLDVLLQEAIPAMMECRDKGLCRALGMTGYPLATQHLILQRSMEEFGSNIWDQALVYSHFNLHDDSLFHQPILQHDISFADFCDQNGIGIMAAAPLSMTLLTLSEPPRWHPACDELKEACQRAADICTKAGTHISTLAILFSMSHPKVPCTLLGMKNKEEVKLAYDLAHRFQNVLITNSTTHEEIMEQVLSSAEMDAMKQLRDTKNGPFANVWKNGNYCWDGVQVAKNFWKDIDPQLEITWQDQNLDSL